MPPDIAAASSSPPLRPPPKPAARCRALEAAGLWGGRLPLAALLAPAIRHAESYVVTPSQARLTAEKLSELEAVPGFAATFLVDGKPPQSGATLKQPALAATLDHLVHARLDDFYRA